MKKIISIVIVSTVMISIYGQTAKTTKFKFKNSAQIEAGGHGLFYSLNYERIIINRDGFKTAGQVGFSYYPEQTGVRDLWIPLVVNELFSFTNHHIEIGIGHIFIREASRDMENNPTTWYWSGAFTGRLGYRYQKPEGRLIIRVGFTPFLEYEDNYREFHPSGGVTFGYCF